MIKTYKYLLTGVFALGLLFLLIAPVYAVDCPAGSTCIDDPFNKLNITSPGGVVTKAFQGFAAVIASLAIAFTVFSGFKLVIASNEESIKSAKASLTWAVGGFIIALLAFTLVAGTAKFLGFDPGRIGENSIVNPINIGDPINSGNFVSVVNFVMINFLGLLGLATILMIIYYGYKYLTAAGNDEAITSAKSGLKWAVLGFVVSLLAYTIIAGVRQYLLAG